MERIAVVILLAVLGQAMHLQSPLLHYLSTSLHYTLPAELFMQQEILALRSRADYIVRAVEGKEDGLKQLADQLETAIDELKEELSQERQFIYHGYKACPPILSFNRTRISLSVAKVEMGQHAMVSYLPTCKNCPENIVDNIYQIQNMTLNYTGYINQTLDGQFCPKKNRQTQAQTGLVNLNQSYFKNNLRAKNWYYGSTTGSDYKIAMFKKGVTFNLTDCPLSKPFVKPGQQICFNCPDDSLFNLGSSACVSCPPGQILNAQTGTCDVCVGQRHFVEDKLQCRPCVLSKGELFNQTSGKCYTCGKGTYLDPQNKICHQIKCTKKQPRFNWETKKCEACPDSTIINPYNITECVKTNYIGICPPSAPKYDFELKKCVPVANQTSVARTHTQAVDPQYDEGCSVQKPWRNPDSNQCQPCKVTHHFDSQVKKCLRTCPPALKLEIESDSCVARCEKGYTFEVRAQKCVPTSMTCTSHQIYDAETGKCMSISGTCKVDQKYDPERKKCVGVKLTCRWNERYNSKEHICQEMVLCRKDQFYNHSLSICEKKSLKCTEEEFWDKNQGKCIRYQFITSPYVENLLYQSQFKNYINFYNKKKDANDKLQDCPNDTPFFSSGISKCIACPEKKPLFDLTHNKCTSCQDNYSYDIGAKSCLPTPPALNSDVLDKINI